MELKKIIPALFLLIPLFSWGQSPLDTRIDFEADDLSVEAALFRLKEVSGLRIAFSHDLLPAGRRVRISLKDVPVREVLSQILGDAGVGFRWSGSQIVLYPEEKPPSRRKFIISGFIQDAESGEKIVGAGIYDEGTQAGVWSNEYGFYSLSLPEGEIRLGCSYPGFQTFRDTFLLTRNQTINIALSPAYLEEVVVKGENDSLSVVTPDLNTDLFVMENVRKMPSLGGEPDVVRVSHLMPGVQTGADGVGGIAVRGGNVDQNLYLLDGVPVYNPHHAIGIYSIFNASAIRSVKLVRGPFPAKYGGRISSVMDIQTKEGNAKAAKVNLDMGLTSAKLTVEGPIEKDKSSFFISGRQALFQLYSIPISSRIRRAEDNDGFISYTFYDLNFKVNHRLSPKDHVYGSFYKGNDGFVDENGLQFMSHPDTIVFFLDDDKVFWGNEIASLRWNHVFSRRLFLNTTITTSLYEYRSDKGVSLEVWKGQSLVGTRAGFVKSESENRDFSLQSDFDFQLNQNHLAEFGLSAIYHRFRLGVIQLDERVFPTQKTLDTLGQHGRGTLESYELDAYFQDDWKVNDRWKINWGLRATVSGSPARWYSMLQPRLLLEFEPVPNWTLSAAVGRMAQHVHLLSPSNNISGLPKDLWVTSTPKVRPQDSWQFVAGVSRRLNGGFEIKANGYYKKMNHLVTFNNISLDDGINSKNWDEQVFEGEGWAWGSEWFIQKKSPRFLGWISYTLAWSTRRFSKEVNLGRTFPYRLDRRHNFNISALYKWSPKFDLSLSWVFASGSALTYPTRSAWYYLPPTETFPYKIIYSYNIASSKNNARFKPYHRLDLGAGFHFDFRKVSYSLHVGVYNAYVRFNPVYAQFNETFSPELGVERKEKQVSLLPIFPALRLSAQFN